MGDLLVLPTGSAVGHDRRRGRGITTVSEVEQRLSAGLKCPATLAGLADKWAFFCTSIGSGYQLTIHGYVHDVFRRDTLQDAINVLD